MVEILDGGVDTGSRNHFIVMEYLNGPNLQQCLNEIPDEKVPILIEQLVSSCEYLETFSLVHRDIKPSNIAILEDHSRLVLLDFGVMKPVGEVGVTDAGGIQSFVGTLQYSSPEFLLREEEDTPSGWRALSLYQVGGVLHDLIMKSPLFKDYTDPYARLVNAVQNDIPNVTSASQPTYLVEACQASLVKDPAIRLKLVSWDSFRVPVKRDAGAAARERVTRRSLLNEAQASPDAGGVTGREDLLEATINLLKVEARRIRGENTAALPPLTVVRVPRWGAAVDIGFGPTDQQGLPAGLTIHIEVEVLDVSSQAISLWVSAFTGTVGVEATEGCSRVPVYRGVFNPATIAGALESSIYASVDCAQQVPQTSQGKSLDLSGLKVI